MEDAKYVYMVIDYSTYSAPAKIAGIFSTRNKAYKRRDELLHEKLPAKVLRRNYSVAKVRLDESMDWFV